MAFSEAAGLKLIADEATFISIMSDLNKEVNELSDKKSQYLALRNRVDDVWRTSDGESEKYKDAIDAQLNNIELALKSVMSALDEFGKLDKNLQNALSSVKTFAETVADEAKQLFV